MQKKKKRQARKKAKAKTRTRTRVITREVTKIPPIEYALTRQTTFQPVNQELKVNQELQDKIKRLGEDLEREQARNKLALDVRTHDIRTEFANSINWNNPSMNSMTERFLNSSSLPRRKMSMFGSPTKVSPAVDPDKYLDEVEVFEKLKKSFKSIASPSQLNRHFTTKPDLRTRLNMAGLPDTQHDIVTGMDSFIGGGLKLLQKHAPSFFNSKNIEPRSKLHLDENNAANHPTLRSHFIDSLYDVLPRQAASSSAAEEDEP